MKDADRVSSAPGGGPRREAARALHGGATQAREAVRDAPADRAVGGDPRPLPTIVHQIDQGS
jgi:hypothetical protein